MSLKISKVKELRLYLHEQLSWPNSLLPLQMRGRTALPSCLASIHTSLPLLWRLLWYPGDLSLGRTQFPTGPALYRQLVVKLRRALSQWWLIRQLSCGQAALKCEKGTIPVPQQRSIQSSHAISRGCVLHFRMKQMIKTFVLNIKPAQLFYQIKLPRQNGFSFRVRCWSIIWTWKEANNEPIHIFKC